MLTSPKIMQQSINLSSISDDQWLNSGCAHNSSKVILDYPVYRGQIFQKLRDENGCGLKCKKLQGFTTQFLSNFIVYFTLQEKKLQKPIHFYLFFFLICVDTETKQQKAQEAIAWPLQIRCQLKFSNFLLLCRKIGIFFLLEFKQTPYDRLCW